jgi:hypothetical protein
LKNSGIERFVCPIFGIGYDKPEEIMVKREHSELQHVHPKAYIVLKSELCYCAFFGSKTLSHICHKHLQHKALSSTFDMHFLILCYLFTTWGSVQGAQRTWLNGF